MAERAPYVSTYPDTELSLVVARYPHTRALTDGPVRTASGLVLRPVPVHPIVDAYRRMIRDLEFDVCEMAISTYLVAREHGIPVTALPIMLNRRFHHGDIVCRADSGIRSAADLAGRRIGVRAYSVTSGVWVRGLLQDQYGLDADQVTWVVDDEEHVQALKLPPTVERAPDGQTLAGLFASGDIDAALSGWAGIGRTGTAAGGWTQCTTGPAQDAYQLFADPVTEERAWYAKTGIYPIHGVLVVKNATLRAHPQLADELTDLFDRARHSLVNQLDAANTDDETRRYRDLTALVGPDPLPYGLQPNEASIRAVIRYCRQQHLLTRTPEPHEVFHSRRNPAVA
jgi:4,5-dihydroxyphthalate decarboxylase